MRIGVLGSARDVLADGGMSTGVPFVVVADRDRAHEALVSAGLRELGYEVQGAKSVYEVHRLLEARPIDALLVDLSLFGTSVTFMNAVLTPRRPLIVVLMLAVGTGLTPEVARASGFDGCFSKIVDVRRLDRYLRDRLPLSRRPPRRAAPVPSFGVSR